MSYVFCGILTFILVPLIIISWIILMIYKLIDKKVNFDKEGGNYIKLKFDYQLVLCILLISSFGMAIVSFKEQIGFSLITVLLLLILSAGIVMYFIYNEYLKKKAVELSKQAKYKKVKYISAIIVALDAIVLETVSYVFWKICL